MLISFLHIGESDSEFPDDAANVINVKEIMTTKNEISSKKDYPRKGSKCYNVIFQEAKRDKIKKWSVARQFFRHNNVTQISYQNKKRKIRRENSQKEIFHANYQYQRTK